MTFWAKNSLCVVSTHQRWRCCHSYSLLNDFSNVDLAHCRYRVTPVRILLFEEKGLNMKWLVNYVYKSKCLVFCWYLFLSVFGVPSRNDFLRFWNPKGFPNGGFWKSIWRLLLKTRKPRFLRPLTRFRQVEGFRFGDFFDTFSRHFPRRPLGGLRRQILMILGSPWGSDGEPFGAKKAIFFEVRF